MSRHEQKLYAGNMDTYFPLAEKRERIHLLAEKYFTGHLLDLGCGEMPYKQIVMNASPVSVYTGVDIHNEIYQKKIKPDAYWDGKTIPFPDQHFETVMLIEVLEHVPKPTEVIREISRVIKQKGVLCVTVPFLWTLHDVPHDEFRYTPFSLKKMLEENHFQVAEMEAFGTWHASMASMIALYLKRGMNKKSRKSKLLSALLLPLIKYLYRKDRKTDKTSFHEGQMITGLWCIAHKK